MSDGRAKLRPITVMAGLAAVGLVAAGFYAWDHGTTTSRGAAMLPIQVGSSSGAARAARPDIAIAPGQPYRPMIYVPAKDLPALSGSAHAWRLTGAEPDATAVARLGAALGLRGSPQPSADGGWTMGPALGPELRVTSVGVRSWSWSYAGSATVSSPGITCARPLPATRSIGPNDQVATPCPTLPAPPPPVDVPNAADAERQVRALLGRAGVDLTGWRVTATGDDSSATVTAAPVLDGMAVEGLAVTVSLGSHGTVTYGAGFFGTPTRGDAYPLIGTRAAVAQLSEGELLGGGVEPMMGVASGGATSATSATSVAPTTTSASVVSPPASSGSSPGSSPASPPGSWAEGSGHVMPTTSLAPLTVTIDRAELVLSAQVGTDGAMWLVPAYRLGASTSPMGSGASWTVLAVPRKYVATPVVRPPMATVEPAGSGTGSSGTGSSGSAGGSRGTAVATPVTAPASTTSSTRG